MKPVLAISATLLIGLFYMQGSAMATEREDMSMILFKSGHGVIATQEIAIDLAQKIIVHVYGEDELAQQLPLSIQDNGDTWIITGRDPTNGKSGPASGLKKGKVEVEIVKYNCQIIKMLQNMR